MLLAQRIITALVQSIAQLSAFGLPSTRIDDRGTTTVYSSLGADLTLIWGSGLLSSLLADLPLAVLLSFWRLLPLAPALRFSQVVVRSLLAAGIGAASVLVVGVVQAIVLAITASAELGRAIVDVVVLAVGSGIYGVPLVVLAGLVAWEWARRMPPTPPESLAGGL